MTEKEKMLNRLPYNANDPELSRLRTCCKDLCFDFNSTKPSQPEKRYDILKLLFKNVGENVIIEQPLYCDYGKNITAGDNLFINHCCVILDCAEVIFGRNVFVAPNCGFYTVSHPLDYETRNKGIETAKPIIIVRNVWIGANTAVLGGVTIGEGCVIGAGSVVKNDMPPNTLCIGNPCRPVKKINN